MCVCVCVLHFFVLKLFPSFARIARSSFAIRCFSRLLFRLFLSLHPLLSVSFLFFLLTPSSCFPAARLSRTSARTLCLWDALGHSNLFLVAVQRLIRARPLVQSVVRSSFNSAGRSVGLSVSGSVGGLVGLSVCRSTRVALPIAQARRAWPWASAGSFFGANVAIYR